MRLNLDEKDLQTGVLGLVVALVEIIKEVLRLQAVRRLESGSLTPEETERLGAALLALDAVIEKIKLDMGIAAAVQSVRATLDQSVTDLLEQLTLREEPAFEETAG